MIRSFKHKGLQTLFETGSTQGIRADHVKKLTRILFTLNEMVSVEEVQPLWRCHKLKGDRINLWSLTVSANWRITFEFKNGDVYILNYEDYH